MSHIIWDPDEWETVTEFSDSGPLSWSTLTQRRRSAESVAKIKAERLAKEEEDILRRAMETAP